jgi:hypothetical protein
MNSRFLPLLAAVVIGWVIGPIAAAQSSSRATQSAGMSRLSAPIPVFRAAGRDACSWGPQIKSYLDIASRDYETKVRAAPSNNSQDIQGYAMVDRPWGRVTVAAVSLHSEGVAVIFKEPIDSVVRELRSRGYRLSRLPETLGYDIQGARQSDATDSSITSITDDEELRLGLTAWSCGD